MSALARHAAARRALRAVELLRWLLLVPLWQRLAAAARIAALRNDLADLERFTRAGERDGTLDVDDLRMYRLHAQALRCRLMMLEVAS